MKFRPSFRSLMLLSLPVALLSGASLVYAQGGAGRSDELAKAERAAKAREQAKELEKDSEVKAPLKAVVPLDPANVWILELSNGGTVKIQLRPDVAPSHVARIKELTGRGFYNGLLFHRVIDGFMAQGGDPKGDGSGGSELPDLTAEFNDLPHVRGTVSMARAMDENSANSQFFIMLMPRMQLDRKYTVLGRVIDGMSYVDAIPKGEPAPEPAKITRAYMMASGS